MYPEYVVKILRILVVLVHGFFKKVAQLSFQNPKRHGKISQLVLSKLSFKKKQIIHEN